jgi:4-hydroxy-tetrahydrodipicolinate reductase
VTAAVVVNGAAGRMGRLVATALRQAGLGPVVGRVRPGSEHGDRLALADGPLPLVGDLVAAVDRGGVIVDFSSPQAADDLGRAARERGARLVIGTTGYTDAALAGLRAAAAGVPVVAARNFSLGLNRMLDLVPWFRILLEDGFDAECLEVHHRAKRDAPSGTALALVEALAPQAPRVYGRSGVEASRVAGEVGLHSLRLGQVVGEHALLFGSDHEVIELRHRALDRAAFVTGVAPAVRFVQTRPPGWYSMQDVIRDAELDAS